MKTRVGACTADLVAGELEDGDIRVISGSVLYGQEANGWSAYLGAYSNQVSALKEGRDRELFAGLLPAKINIRHSMSMFQAKTAKLGVYSR